MRYGYVENGKLVEGPRHLPTAWRNISGLNKMSPEALLAAGWLPWVTTYTPGDITVRTTVEVRATDILETIERRSLTQQEVAAEIAARAEAVAAQRREAYAAEADPLFFKWQRGEASQQDWLNKVAEIKARFPK
jgi:hypothetical protein